MPWDIVLGAEGKPETVACVQDNAVGPGEGAVTRTVNQVGRGE